MPFDWEYQQAKQDVEQLLYLNEQEPWRHGAELVRDRLIDFLRDEGSSRALCEAVVLMGQSRTMRKQAERDKAERERAKQLDSHK